MAEKTCKICGSKFNPHKIRDEIVNKSDSASAGDTFFVLYLFSLIIGGGKRYCSKACAAEANERAKNNVKKEKTVLWRIGFFLTIVYVIPALMLGTIVLYRLIKGILV